MKYLESVFICVLLLGILPLFVFEYSKRKENSKVADDKSHSDSDTVIVKNKPSKFQLDKGIEAWYYLDPLDKYLHVVHMVHISKGAFRYTVSDTNDMDLVNKEMFQLVKNVSNCTDSVGYLYYKEFERDVQIGSVLINCLIRNNFH